MIVRPISNPRKPDGDFGDTSCDLCSNYSGAYVKLIHINSAVVVCKGCILSWIDLINNTVLDHAVESGRLRELEK